MCTKWDIEALARVPIAAVAMSIALQNRAYPAWYTTCFGKGVRPFIPSLFTVILLLAPACAPALSAAAGEPAPAEPSVRAQDLSEGSPLSLDQALLLAEQNSPLLKEASATVDRSHAGIQTARAYTNPSAEFLAGQQSARAVAIPGMARHSCGVCHRNRNDCLAHWSIERQVTRACAIHRFTRSASLEHSARCSG